MWFGQQGLRNTENVLMITHSVLTKHTYEISKKGLLVLRPSPSVLLGAVQKTLSCVPTEALLRVQIQESPFVCKQKDQIFAMATSPMTRVPEHCEELFYCTKRYIPCVSRGHFSEEISVFPFIGSFLHFQLLTVMRAALTIQQRSISLQQCLYLVLQVHNRALESEELYGLIQALLHSSLGKGSQTKILCCNPDNLFQFDFGHIQAIFQIFAPVTFRTTQTNVFLK